MKLTIDIPIKAFPFFRDEFAKIGIKLFDMEGYVAYLAVMGVLLDENSNFKYESDRKFQSKKEMANICDPVIEMAIQAYQAASGAKLYRDYDAEGQNTGPSKPVENEKPSEGPRQIVIKPYGDGRYDVYFDKAADKPKSIHECPKCISESKPRICLIRHIGVLGACAVFKTNAEFFQLLGKVKSRRIENRLRNIYSKNR